MDSDTSVDLTLLASILKSTPERYVRAVAEEAGEVVGAYNKWADGRTDKPCTRDDVLEELSQLVGCGYLLARELGVTPEALDVKVKTFLIEKARSVNAARKGDAA